MERCTVRVMFRDGRPEEDLSVPIDITAYELVQGINKAYRMEYTEEQLRSYSLRGENPICLIRGAQKLREYGIHNGSIIHIP